MWSHRLQSLPISWLSGMRFLHKAHLPIFITSELPLWGNLSLALGLRCPIERAIYDVTPSANRNPYPSHKGEEKPSKTESGYREKTEERKKAAMSRIQ